MKKISIGTAQFGVKYGINNKKGKLSQSEINRIINFCVKNKIYYFDTSQNYGDAEKKIGIYLQKHKKKLKITTKVNSFKFNSIKKSIDRLNCVPDAVLFHNFKDFLNNSFRERIIKECEKYNIKKIGVSIYKNDQLEKVFKISKINVIQLPLNIIDRYFLESKLLDKLKKKKIEIQIRSVFLQGLLLTNKNRINKDFPQLKKNLEILRNLALLNKVSMSELCLLWALSLKKVNKIILGIDNINQLKENLNTLRIKKKLIKKNLIDKIDFKDLKILDPRNWS